MNCPAAGFQRCPAEPRFSRLAIGIARVSEWFGRASGFEGERSSFPS